MDSHEQNKGGGSGGDPVGHDDIRFLNGTFARNAPNINLLASPEGATDGSTEFSKVDVVAAGEKAWIRLYAEHLVLIRTGIPGDPSESIHIPMEGVMLYSPEGRITLIQGDISEGGASENRHIILSPSGIFIDAGETGQITLRCGPQGDDETAIRLDPTGITLTGPMININ